MQKSDFLTSLFEPARAKILRLFCLHDKEKFPLGEITKRCGLSLVAVKKELKSLQAIGIVRETDGEGTSARERKAGTTYSLNDRFRFANALTAFIHEISPEKFNDVERALRHTGKLTVIVLSGIFIGDTRRPADLLIVGEDVNESRLEKVVKSFELRYGREIRYTLFSTPEFRYRMGINDKLLRDTLDYPHRLLLDTKNLV